jgi:hypothetical protein
MWYTTIIPALRRLRQEGHKLKTSSGYIDRPVFKEEGRKERNLIFYKVF